MVEEIKYWTSWRSSIDRPSPKYLRILNSEGLVELQTPTATIGWYCIVLPFVVGIPGSIAAFAFLVFPLYVASIIAVACVVATVLGLSSVKTSFNVHLRTFTSVRRISCLNLFSKSVTIDEDSCIAIFKVFSNEGSGHWKLTLQPGKSPTFELIAFSQGTQKEDAIEFSIELSRAIQIPLEIRA